MKDKNSFSLKNYEASDRFLTNKNYVFGKEIKLIGKIKTENGFEDFYLNLFVIPKYVKEEEINEQIFEIWFE